MDARNKIILVRQTMLLLLAVSVCMIVLGQTPAPADRHPLPAGLEGLNRFNGPLLDFANGYQDLLTVCGFLLLLTTAFLAMVAALVEHYTEKAPQLESGEDASQKHTPDQRVS